MEQTQLTNLIQTPLLSLIAHPQVRPRIDRGLSGLTLVDQIASVALDAQGKNPRDPVINEGLKYLRTQYPVCFPGKEINSYQIRSKPEEYKSINGF